MSNEVRIPPADSQFLTITIKPKLYQYASTTQYEITCHEIGGIINKTIRNFELVPEHTNAGNIHYHAWIHDNKPHATIHCINALKRNKLTGFIKLTPERITTPESIDRVHKYLSKAVEETTKGLKTIRRTIVINENDYIVN